MDSHDLHALIEQNLRAAERNEQVAREVLVDMEALVGRGSSRTGTRAYVDHRGLVTDLAISPSSLDLSLDELRDDVLTSVNAAISDVRSQAAPLQARLAFDPRPLEQQTDVLDALDALLTGADTAPSATTAPPTTGGHP